MASATCRIPAYSRSYLCKKLPTPGMLPAPRRQILRLSTTSKEPSQLSEDGLYDQSLPFRTATQRLKDLLEAASWESDGEMLRHEVANMVPEMKLCLFTNMGSVLTLAAFLVSWITGEDPLGGFGLADDSLGAAAVGAGYALPLMLCSVFSRLAAVRSSFPVLEDLQDSQQEIVRPIVKDLNASQLLILASVAVVPSMLVLLPACHGALSVLGHILTAELMQPLGVHPHLHLPEGLRRQAGVLLPAVCSAYFAAWLVTKQLDVNDRQVTAIRDALESADRYFLHAAAERAAERPDILQRPAPPSSQQRLSEAGGGPVMSFASAADAGAQDEGCSSSGCNGPLRQLGAEMSQAFKTVSILWLMTRRKAARLAYVLTALNVSYFGIIWHHTRDLGTPVVAALLATLTELLLIKHFPRGRSTAAGSTSSHGMDA